MKKKWNTFCFLSITCAATALGFYETEPGVAIGITLAAMLIAIYGKYQARKQNQRGIVCAFIGLVIAVLLFGDAVGYATAEGVDTSGYYTTVDYYNETNAGVAGVVALVVGLGLFLMVGRKKKVK